MKKFLVTGATGFVGNYVIEELLKNNVTVIATSTNIEKAQQFAWFSKVVFIPFNLETYDAHLNYFQYFNNPDSMIHLAWEGLPNYKSDFHLVTNLPRHSAFLENLISNGLKDVTVTGTCFEYGMQEGCLSEDMQPLPDNPYAVAKDELRKRIESLQKIYNFSFKWARLFYMYGKGQNPKSILSQLEAALKNGETVFNMSGGEQIRDYLPIEKVAENIVKISMQHNINGIINCCSGNPIKIKDFVAEYLLSVNKKINLNLGYYPYPDYEPMRFWGD
ncbi:MAG TPA: NAD-dependent epimerase/dehydratase family protein, partial [Chitinophagales bacterium]|nr:NAD-dependent epimerase/dehydratase family protein [Chitinophagales bacterium]